MKKIPIAVLLLWMSTVTLFAQDAGEFTLGIRGGILFGFHKVGSDLKNYISDEFDRYPTEESLLNPNAVAYGNYAVTDNIAIQGELNFMINQDIKFSAYGYTVEGTGICLDIPVLLKYVLVTDQMRIGILAGPYLSFPLGKFKTSGYYSDGWEPEGFVYGITAGLFAGYPTGKGRFVGDIRFIFDLSPMKINDYGYIMEIMERRGIALTAGYEIPSKPLTDVRFACT